MTALGVDGWLSKLNAEDLPVLGAVVRSLNLLTGSEETRVNQLSDVVLKDANLTSHLLRVSNSNHFNPGSSGINTITRAIIQVGFEGVKNICISLMLVDQLLGPEPRQRLLVAMARAFHAAMQARLHAGNRNNEAGEEVFIAGLLFHLGELAIWAKGEAQADELNQLLNDGKDEREACEQVLGVQFNSLTRELVRSWHLGEVLEKALNPATKPTPIINAVLLADQLSEVAPLGWDSPECRKVLERIAKFRRVDYEVAKADAIATADKAAEIALTFGAGGVCHLIPGSSARVMAANQQVPDIELQRKVLRELGSVVKGDCDINTIFQMVLEGMHRGIALARVAVVFQVKKKLIARYALGASAAAWRNDWQQDADDVHLFSEALLFRGPQWLDEARLGKIQHLYSDEVKSLVGTCPCFISPIKIKGRVVGLYYADNGEGGADLNAEQFEAFTEFCDQTQVALVAISAQGIR